MNADVIIPEVMNDAKVNTLIVPRDFGNIQNVSDQDPFQPWLVEKCIGFDAFDNPVYEEVGGFETFNESLLALIMINSIEKSNNNKATKLKLEKDYLDCKIDEMIRKTQRRISPGELPIYIKNSPENVFEGNNEDCDDEYYERQEAVYHNAYFPPINPYQLSSRLNPALDYNNPLMKLTVKEVYERWYQDKSLEDVTPHTMEGYRNSFKKISHLSDRVFVELRFSEIEDCVKAEKARGNSFSMRKRIKLFFSQLYQWAISHEICTSNMALNIKLGKNESDKRRKPFTLKQIATLFEHVDEDPFIESVLMLIFCGCRIREFLNIKRQDIHMSERYFIVTESKTKAGRNRMVPIHKKMMKYYRKRLRAKSDYLIHDARGRQVDYGVYATKFKNLMKRFGWDGLSPHCARHTCSTLLHSAGADPVTSRRILGHVGTDIHERVYTHIILKDLLEAIDKV